jgi:hypothetical protein
MFVGRVKGGLGHHGLSCRAFRLISSVFATLS